MCVFFNKKIKKMFYITIATCIDRQIKTEAIPELQNKSFIYLSLLVINNYKC